MLKKNRLNSIVLIFIIVSILAGCEVNDMNTTAYPLASTRTNNNVDETRQPSLFVGKYPINNEEDADTLITHEYPLSELTDYFGMDQYSDGGYYTYIGKVLSIEAVNAKFPVECLREIEDTNDKVYYTIYKVKEGGRYFVFWSICSDGEYIAGNSDYINGIKNINDFRDLRLGVSTYNDVIAIDPSTELHIYTAGDLFSLSLLDDYNELYILYTGWGKGDELIIQKMEVIANNTLGFFSHINKFDLVFD